MLLFKMRSVSLRTRAETVKRVAEKSLMLSRNTEAFHEPIYRESDSTRVQPLDASSAEIYLNGSLPPRVWIKVPRYGKPRIFYNSRTYQTLAEGMARDLRNAGLYILPIKATEMKS
ncbi:hypothetical protein HYT84_01370 [Candidatus Micrarchaeota archaeon]|nr:hypothetical protein [Candidatus Micrarchaeota archaeon]